MTTTKQGTSIQETQSEKQFKKILLVIIVVGFLLITGIQLYGSAMLGIEEFASLKGNAHIIYSILLTLLPIIIIWRYTKNSFIRIFPIVLYFLWWLGTFTGSMITTIIKTFN